MADDLVARLTKLAQVIEGWPPTVWTETAIDIRAAAAEIERLRAAPAPAGYAVVPVEPTDKMIAAGRDAVVTNEWSDDLPGEQQDAVAAYRAMIAAAKEDGK